jgi:hypothetical protein
VQLWERYECYNSWVHHRTAVSHNQFYEPWGFVPLIVNLTVCVTRVYRQSFWFINHKTTKTKRRAWKQKEKGNYKKQTHVVST